MVRFGICDWCIVGFVQQVYHENGTSDVPLSLLIYHRILAWGLSQHKIYNDDRYSMW